MIAKRKLYWISSIPLFGMMIVTGLWYFVCYEDLVIYFESYGYPVYLIYPLAILKIAGSMVILINNNRFLVELAYAGFLFNFILAFFAHLMINEFDPFPTLSLILLIISYRTGKSIRG